MWYGMDDDDEELPPPKLPVVAASKEENGEGPARGEKKGKSPAGEENTPVPVRGTTTNHHDDPNNAKGHEEGTKDVRTTATTTARATTAAARQAVGVPSSAVEQTMNGFSPVINNGSKSPVLLKTSVEASSISTNVLLANSEEVSTSSSSSAAVGENHTSSIATSTSAENNKLPQKIINLNRRADNVNQLRISRVWNHITHIRFAELYRTTANTLGKGLNGSVLLGSHRSTRRPVAIKTLDLGKAPERVDFFEKEIEVTRNFKFIYFPLTVSDDFLRYFRSYILFLLFNTTS